LNALGAGLVLEVKKPGKKSVRKAVDDARRGKRSHVLQGDGGA
jgi:hypothetical protein